MLQNALTNQLLTFPPWQEVLQRDAGVRMTTSCVTTVEETATSCTDLTVLLQQDHSPVIDLELAVILETPHLDNVMSL